MKILFFLLLANISFGQKSIDKLLKENNKETVPYIFINDFKALKKPIVLDTREIKEFEVSHLQNAQCVGFDHFKIKDIQKKYTNKNDTIVVYCSVSIRSEMIGNQLKKAGYKNVFNLYGGIFGWKNHDQLIYDNQEKITEKVHTFSKEWSKYLIKGIKIY